MLQLRTLFVKGGFQTTFSINILIKITVSKSINCLYIFKSFTILARVLGITIMAPIIVVIVKANILASLLQSKGKDSYNKPCL